MREQRRQDADGTERARYHLEAEFPLRLRLLRWLGRQTWMPLGQDRLLRLLRDPDASPHYLFEVDFFGQRYRGDLAHYADWMVFCYGSTAYSELSLLEELVSRIRARRQGLVNFVDVGANAGHHTLFMARLADFVLAIEPFPALHPLIEEKIALNRLMNVRLARVGLGERDEVLDYHPGEGANSGIGTFLPNDESNARPVKLSIRKGDDFFDELHLGRIDLLKVDVEGYEPFVLQGMQGRMRRDRPVVLMELSDASRRGFGSEDAFRRLFYDEARFAAVEGRAGRAFELAPFDYDTTQEVLVVPPEMDI